MARTPKGEYVGRLMADGQGNLLADESVRVGERPVTMHDEQGNPIPNGDGGYLVMVLPIMEFGDNHGQPVTFDPDSDTYQYVQPGELSHNERFSLRDTDPIVATQDVDPDLPGYAGTADKPAKGLEHHFRPREDDPHYEEDATDDVGRLTHTRLKSIPDAQRRNGPGHTDWRASE